jgi:hypothetical protein
MDEIEKNFKKICTDKKKDYCTKDPNINGCSDGFFGCNLDKTVFKETLNKEFEEDKIRRMNEIFKDSETASKRYSKTSELYTSICDTNTEKTKLYSHAEYVEYCDLLGKSHKCKWNTTKNKCNEFA